MSNRFKFRIYSFLDKSFHYFSIGDGETGYPQGIAGGVSEPQQYTGLTDKNGKEVYEGDVVKIKRWYLRPFINNKQEIDYQHIEGETEIGQVIWGWNSQKYLVSYEHIRYDDSEDFDKSSHSVEVIGNILENPELLK